ncbi:MAG: cadherin-like beta sandwich domain-containing protein [Firmicutes bacterium]|nr:cadherin-like beta sandwich domain-containing protein [Bacillota bacterium]
MKKYIFGFICGILLLMPSIISAKKVTCSNGDYNATIEINKEKININELATITIDSESTYEIEYKIADKDIANINEGVITALKEGNTTIKTEITFAENSSCIVNLPIEVVSNDSLLKSLNLEELDISSVFKSDKYEYEINLPYNFEKINIIAEANNSNAKITGDGRRYLNEGVNEYEIVVTATDGSTSTYKIIINREEANEDVTLKSLIVEGYVLSPKFDKETYRYTLNIDKAIEEITIHAETAYEFAKIRGTGTFSVATGQNTYYIIVTAENGNEGQYEVVINKSNGTSRLESLEIAGIKLDSEFSSDKYIYYIDINSNIKTLDIKAKAVDNDQIEIIGNENLDYGKNEIIIRVTGEDKSSTTYKIIANKLNAEEEQKIEKNDKLLKILLITFIVSIIIMITVIGIFLKRNYKREVNINKKRKNKKK